VLHKFDNCFLRVFSRAHRAITVPSLKGEMAVPPVPLPRDCRQASFRLRSAKSVIDRIVGEGILKIRQFLNCTRGIGSRKQLWVITMNFNSHSRKSVLLSEHMKTPVSTLFSFPLFHTYNFIFCSAHDLPTV
jgi:hypothetical protein